MRKQTSVPPTARERMDDKTMENVLREFALPIEDKHNFEASPVRRSTPHMALRKGSNKPVASLSPVRNQHAQ